MSTSTRHSLSTPRWVAGFTLVELLTVIAIIGILAGILIPVVGTVRAKARMSTSLSNLRQLGTAVQIFITDNRGTLPVNSSSHSTHYWYRELWKIIYGDRTRPAIPPTPDTGERYTSLLSGTVFYTPLMEMDAGARSFGFSPYLNEFVGTAPSIPATPLRIERIANPPRTLMIADSKNMDLYTKDLMPRNNGQVHCLFVDGHVAKLFPPDSTVTDPAAERRIPHNPNQSTFWRGVERNSSGALLIPY
ncbi:prepilin-type N-terminal cleavage/methylation domain-containing protein [Opitutaceae bacterium TAV4]|nr:prepilin-type N-terminal cleavage/methylation domain-containing protein [Opitutaceae bacterium TAV4]RRK00249.1 prepilin-type N-terminal cleavage/methylation domain-containing protein [Opitutaceae bacterium TAV3]